MSSLFSISFILFLIFNLQDICRYWVEEFKVLIIFLWGKFWLYYHLSAGATWILPWFMEKIPITQSFKFVCVYGHAYMIYTNTTAHIEIETEMDYLAFTSPSWKKSAVAGLFTIQRLSFIWIPWQITFIHSECLCVIFFIFISLLLCHDK